jgi:predicted porin
MKKQLLLGSTALIVGALAAPDFAAAEDPLRLSVRGYKNEYFGLGDVDNDSNSGHEATSHFSDGEVHFKGTTDLDNGITVGVDVQLEAFGATGDDIDEAYTWLSGDFGKVVIGSENLPDYLTFWAVTAPNVGVPINSGWISVWAPAPTLVATGFRNSIQTTNVTLTNDTFQIGYQSPRFSGFQFVAGYAPTNATSGDPKNAVTDVDAEIHNILSVGANFSESFNGVDVGVAAGYEHGEQADTSTLDDPQIYKVGASIGVSGFSVAGSYAVNDVDTAQEGEAFDVGVSYSTGPWGVSATWFHGEQEGTAGGDDDEVDAFVGAVSYSVGPGITASGSLFYGKWEDEAGVQESESVMGIVGLAISF